MENKSVKQQIVDRLKEANNVLVTVSANPSVDQLAACIGLTLMLNKLDKHSTAVFSGRVPSTLEFLQPEKTLEKTTDSLRDFIISLDKSKADKLRYKVEDKLVKIFITPYRTSITDKDLEFSQGDFNVDVVVALGVSKREDLDQAIVSHGRILHDATVMSLGKVPAGDLGTMNWYDPNISSLSEMVASISDELHANLLDGQMATALLTGIVAETERFRNSKTTPQTMSVSAKLMAAGANQQLIASQFDRPTSAGASPKSPKGNEPQSGGDAGALSIDHKDQPSKESSDSSPKSPDKTEESTSAVDRLLIDEDGQLSTAKPLPDQGSMLTANTRPESLDPSTDPLTLPSPQLNLSHQPSTVASPKLEDYETLTKIEKDVQSPHLSPTPAPFASPPVPPLQPYNAEPAMPPFGPNPTEAATQAPTQPPVGPEPLDGQIDEARNAVQQAIQASPPVQLEPVEALGAQPIDLNESPNASPATYPVPDVPAPPAGLSGSNWPSGLSIPTEDQGTMTNASGPASPPPPVPPPLPSQYLPPPITPMLPTAEEFEQKMAPSDDNA